MKRFFWHLISVAFVLMMVCCMIATASAAEADADRIEAHQAYYNYLQAEIEGIGQPVRDEDYYNMYIMYTNKEQSPAIMEKILSAYLIDLTNDGVEELIIKRLVRNQVSSSIYITRTTEWICIYSYVDGDIARIGQNLPWYKSNGADGWNSYHPDGYIGFIPSLSSVPSYQDEFLTLCYGQDGKAYLCEGEISQNSFTLYSFNGTHMEEDTTFTHSFVPDWSIGDIHSSTGKHYYRIDGKTVTDSAFAKKRDECTGGGTYKLTDNDYNAVLNILSETIAGKDVLFGDANPHCHQPTDWIAEDGQHYRACHSGCDVKLELGTCEGGQATCMQKAICTVCEKPYGEFAEHIPATRYSSENGKHYFACQIESCTAIFSEGDCVDDNKNHRCDVCADYVGIHEAAAGTHICDYCGSEATRCWECDEENDHICDVCGGEVGIHEADDDEHICRYCDEAMSECIDSDKDGWCDICKEDLKSGKKSGLAIVIVGVIAVVGASVWIVLTKRKKGLNAFPNSESTESSDV